MTDLSPEILTNDKNLLNALDNNPSEEDRKTLVLFAEVLPFFEEEDKTRIYNHLLKFVKDYRDTIKEDEITVLGSAARKMVAYLPENCLNDYIDVISGKLTHEFQLEILKGLHYRMMWDVDIRTKITKDIKDKVFEILNVVYNEFNSEGMCLAITKNAIVILVLTMDERIWTFCDNVSAELDWIVDYIVTYFSDMTKKSVFDGDVDTFGFIPQFIERYDR